MNFNAEIQIATLSRYINILTRSANDPGITAHYIDKFFNLYQPLLAFEALEERHTGVYLATIVLKVIHEYGITEKLNCITTDNASNNFTMVRHLSSRLFEEGIEWDYRTQHIPCLAHIINLVVKEFLNNLEEDEEGGFSFLATLKKIRAIAKAIRSSPRKWEIFEQCCKSYDIRPMTIPLDVAVRWNATYRMLEQAVYLRRPIRRFVEEDDSEMREFQLSEEEWDLAEVLLVFLMPFKRCTTRFECNSTTPEIDYVFFAYDKMFNHIEDVKTALSSGASIGVLPCAPFMSKALDEMELTLKRYYSKTDLPTVYGDAMILNPRCKLSLFEDDTWSEEDAIRYETSCRNRFQQYTTDSTSTNVEVGVMQSDGNGIRDLEFAEMLAKRGTKRRRNDIDRYIDIPPDPNIKSSLEWWKANHTMFPDLAKFARDVLPVPASGCKVEREFSVLRKIAMCQRSSLSASTIANLMMCKSVLRKRPKEADDIDELPIPENSGNIPPEWEGNWWFNKLKRPVRPEISDLFLV